MLYRRSEDETVQDGAGERVEDVTVDEGQPVAVKRLSRIISSLDTTRLVYLLAVLGDPHVRDCVLRNRPALL